MMKTEQLQELQAFRRELHQYPELSGQEYETQKRIENFLKKNGIVGVKRIGETGVLVIFHSENPGPSIMLRADIDALPIEEGNSFEYRSKTPGISHKCGHDGHTAILAGLALKLAEHPPETGQVLLLFQPSEENGKGAQMVLNDPVFQQYQIDYSFALHNLPGFPKHHAILKDGAFTAYVKSVIFRMEGKTAHAAEPEKGNNPALAISSLIEFSAQLSYNNPNSDDFFLATPIHINMGEIAYGVSAGAGEVHLTLRSWSSKLMKDNSKRLEAHTRRLTKAHQLDLEIEWLEEFPTNTNDKEANQIIEKAVRDNSLGVWRTKVPFKWGEDFGWFNQQLKGAMFGLGAGSESPALHHPDYDFPDDIIEGGINIFHSIINETLQS